MRKYLSKYLAYSCFFKSQFVLNSAIYSPEGKGYHLNSCSRLIKFPQNSTEWLAIWIITKTCNFIHHLSHLRSSLHILLHTFHSLNKSKKINNEGLKSKCVGEKPLRIFREYFKTIHRTAAAHYARFCAMTCFSFLPLFFPPLYRTSERSRKSPSNIAH